MRNTAITHRIRKAAGLAVVAVVLMSVAASAQMTSTGTGHVCTGGTWWINQTEVGLGKPLPEFGFKPCGGEEHSIADFAGQPVLVNFWATWCPPCIEELPNLKEFAEDSDGEVKVVGISIDDDRGALERFTLKNMLGYDVAWDNGGIADDLGITSIPLTIALNRDGELVGLHEGYATVDDLKELAKKAKTR